MFMILCMLNLLLAYILFVLKLLFTYAFIGAFYVLFYWSDKYSSSHIYSSLLLYQQLSLSVLNIPSGLPS